LPQVVEKLNKEKEIVGNGNGLKIKKYFSKDNSHPFDEIEWETRDAVIGDPDNPVFQQKDIEVPKSWSQNATNIVAQKYFRGPLWTGEREHSIKQMITRVSNTIATWGIQDGYFDSHESFDNFQTELEYILVNQMAAFNSPVWFNVGHKKNPQCSACFILSVEDNMESILEWNTTEGIIFKNGSGAGINLSNIRGSREGLSKGGIASGPVSFMRGTDAWAGSIKSGGATRRAAKLICLDADHPDIEKFIWCKTKEERKARALAEAGFDMSIDGEDFKSIQYQNANNSVRVSDTFMEYAISKKDFVEDWILSPRTSQGEEKRVDASKILEEIAQAAWECADPGIQYDTTINDWHTCPKSGRIEASNPCGEFNHLNNSSCNLASLNLLKFLDDDGNFNIEGFKNTIDITFLAQEILIDRASYPTEKIEKNTKDFRQIGLGYSNLGALLMTKGLPYDSDRGRELAGAITALMTGQAYKKSAEIAQVKGSYNGFKENCESHLEMMCKHQNHIKAGPILEIEPAQDETYFIKEEASKAWSENIDLGYEYGYRNSQATVLAPCGTISFLMDCDTTGIEPAFSLETHKELVGGGNLKMTIGSVDKGKEILGISHGTDISDNPVFATAVGKNYISPEGHIRMMAAVQPFLSGAISKTVNMPEETTVNEIKEIFIQSWKLGLKSVAIYRDGSKTTQAIRTKEHIQQKNDDVQITPTRKRLPNERQSVTHKFSIGGHEGYITAGMYEDGSLGEVFITDLGKNGSTINGMIQAFATAVSVGLQYGVPLETLIRKFSYMKFEPEGITGNKDIPFAKSIPDYVMRWLAFKFLNIEQKEKLGIKSHIENQPNVNPNGKIELEMVCHNCGGLMKRTGTCYTCITCGENSGCS